MSMLIYQRYISLDFLKYFFNILLTVIIIFWLTQSLRLIELIAVKGISVTDFLKITVLLLPPMLYIAVPIASFIATLVLFNSLHDDRELTILNSSGLSGWQIIKPIVRVAACIMILHYLVSFYFLPNSYREFKDLQDYFKNQFVSLLLEEKVFNTQSSNLTVYIDERINDTFFKGIFIYNNNNTQKPISIIAQSGHIIKTNKGPEFILYQGLHQEENKATDSTSTIIFDEYHFSIDPHASAPTVRFYDANEMYIDELLQKKEDGTYNAEHLVNANQRISWPLYSLAFVFTAAAFIVGGFDRRGLLNKNLISAIMGIVFIGLSLLSNSLAMKNHHLIPLMYLNIVILFLLGFFWINYQDKFLMGKPNTKS
jgi:lipopolysaccharide export system permease protein